MKRITVLMLILLLATFVLRAEDISTGWAYNTGEAFSICGNTVAVDSKGCVFVGGSIRDDQNDVKPDALLIKLNPEGKPAGSVINGGYESDLINSLAIDTQGNCYAIGDFSQGIEFGNISITGYAEGGVFVAKMDTLGIWLWVTGVGATSGYIWSDAITTDPSGNCYVTGSFEGTAAFGQTTLTSNGSMDIFIAKADPDGKWLWAVNAGGALTDMVDGIRLDASGNIYVSGQFKESMALGTTRLVSKGESDGFVASLDNKGKWLWAMQTGGEEDDFGRGVALDSQANCYFLIDISGEFSIAGKTIENPDDASVCLIKLDQKGNVLWYKLADISSGRALTVDKDDNCIVAGVYYGTGTWGTQTATSNGHEDIFIAKLDSNGNLLWLKTTGNTSSDVATDIITDPAGNIYVTGSFSKTVAFGPTSLTSKGISDLYIYKISLSE